MYKYDLIPLYLKVGQNGYDAANQYFFVIPKTLWTDYVELAAEAGWKLPLTESKPAGSAEESNAGETVVPEGEEGKKERLEKRLAHFLNISAILVFFPTSKNHIDGSIPLAKDWDVMLESRDMTQMIQVDLIPRLVQAKTKASWN